MAPDAITGRLAAVVERAPGLATALRNADDGAPRTIIAKARGALERMTEAERVAVLNAHPRIGADAASLSTRSRREQGEAADGATSQEHDELHDYYEHKFRLTLVRFVSRWSRSEVVALLR